MSSSSKQPKHAGEVFEIKLVELIQSTPQGVEGDLMIQKDGQYLGDLSATKLRSLFKHHEEECKELLVKNASESDYVPLFQHSLFQRRRPQLVSSSHLTKEATEDIFVLKNGIKQGPYTFEELKVLVKECQVLPTDYLSTNQGETWAKIFSYEEFDRRNYTQPDLPSAPKSEVLNTHLQSATSQNHETEALTGLAYLGNLRTGKSREHAKKQYDGDITNPSMKNPLKGDVDKFHYFWVGLFFVSFAGIIMVLLTWNSSKPQLEAQDANPSPQQVTSQQAKVQQQLVESRRGQTPPTPKLTGQPIQRANTVAPPPTPIENVPAPRVQRLQKRAQASRTSLIQSRGAREALADQDNESEQYDDYAYDNGDTPYEQDPVRSRVSRQTLNPDTEQQDWASTLSGGRAPAAYEDDPYADDAMDLFEDY